MDKSKILEGLSNIQHGLQDQKEKLDKLVTLKIWSEEIKDELNDTVKVLQNMSKQVNKLIDIQRRVLLKPHKGKK